MASGGVDLEKIIKILSENPELLMGILSKLNENQNTESDSTESTNINTGLSEKESIPTSLTHNEKGEEAALQSAPVSVGFNSERGARNENDKRKRLISALRGCVSPKRQKSLESMLLISEIIDTMKGG